MDQTQTVSSDSAQESDEKDVVAISEEYYDSSDADQFYMDIWGGEDIHIGLYDETDDIKEASRRTVERMAGKIQGQGQPLDGNVIDLGAGYGGGARYLAKTYGASVVCLNLSSVQNAYGERLNAEQGLADKVRFVHGSFEEVPEDDESFDVAWSQDAFLHSGNRELPIREAYRVLKPGGHLIFTDPMQADDCPEGVLQPVYDRIHLQSLGSFGFYKECAERLGFETVEIEDLTYNLRNHYNRVREELEANYDRLAATTNKTYLDRMIVGLGNWVAAADSGYLTWGILHFRKK